MFWLRHCQPWIWCCSPEKMSPIFLKDFSTIKWFQCLKFLMLHWSTFSQIEEFVGIYHFKKNTFSQIQSNNFLSHKQFLYIQLFPWYVDKTFLKKDMVKLPSEFLQSLLLERFHLQLWGFLNWRIEDVSAIPVWNQHNQSSYPCKYHLFHCF